MSEEQYPGIAELARQVRDVLVRFETLGARLETQFVRADIFQLWLQSFQQDLKDLTATKEKEHKELAERDKSERDHLTKRVSDLEDNIKWVVRLVIGFILLGILGAALTFTKGGGA